MDTFDSLCILLCAGSVFELHTDYIGSHRVYVLEGKEVQPHAGYDKSLKFGKTPLYHNTTVMEVIHAV